MKKLTLTFVLAFAVMLTAVQAEDNKISKNHPKYDQIEANLIQGLKSDNNGLKFSSAYMLGEMKSENAINELLQMLRNNNDESFRIMAALSLTKIGTERSLFMVRRVGEFTDKARLANFCQKFFNAKTLPFTKQDQILVSQLGN